MSYSWTSVVVSNIFYFPPYLEKIFIQFDSYFSDGLVQPPTSYSWDPRVPMGGFYCRRSSMRAAHSFWREPRLREVLEWVRGMLLQDGIDTTLFHWLCVQLVQHWVPRAVGDDAPWIFSSHVRATLSARLDQGFHIQSSSCQNGPMALPRRSGALERHQNKFNVLSLARSSRGRKGANSWFCIWGFFHLHGTCTTPLKVTRYPDTKFNGWNLKKMMVFFQRNLLCPVCHFQVPC